MQSGAVSKVIAKLPPSARGSVKAIATSAFASGLNLILLVAAIVALASGVIAFGAIRGKDFAAQH